jgi:hypothetical protein
MKRLLKSFLLLAGLLSASRSAAQSLSLSGGNVTFSITEANLQSGTGSDFVDTYTNTLGTIQLSVSGQSFGKTWKVDVHREDLAWNPNLHIDVQRSASTYNFLSGGTTYSEITLIDREFFHTTQKKAANNVQLQYQLRGVSLVNLPAGVNYSTRIVYTLMDYP